MKKYYFTITSILFLVIGLASCSNEETKTQNQLASRPTVPPQNDEVQIGNQIWMTKNLNVSRYRNGDPIPQVTNTTEWANLTIGAWCYYNNDPVNGQIYGKLYNWYAVKDSRGLAPIGYHVPTDMEWTVLTTFLGGQSVAGGKMKEIGAMHWGSPNTNATNSSGFTALPGGSRGNAGSFGNIRYAGNWWSSSADDTTYAWSRQLLQINGNASRYSYDNASGFSVRCLRD